MKLATRTTKSGTVEGRCEGGVCRFFGVPYAAPPVDDLRFEPPQPVQPWEGTRDARNPGRVRAAQDRGVSGDRHRQPGWRRRTSGRRLSYPQHLDARGRGQSPCHGLHPWRRLRHRQQGCAGPGWIAFARSGVVCVAINYRLGHRRLPADPRRADQPWPARICSRLHWVQENIASFGGDPDNVTVFGELAGAMAIAEFARRRRWPRACSGAPSSKAVTAAMVRATRIAQRLVRSSPRS